MSPILIGMFGFIAVLLLICVVMLFELAKDARRRLEQLRMFAETFNAMLNEEALKKCKLSKRNLADLKVCIDETGVSISKILGSSYEGERAVLASMIVDRVNQFSSSQAVLREMLERAEEKMIERIDAREDVTEYLEEVPEDEIIELTEVVEKKPMEKRRWGEVCAPKPPIKPMAKRRWGEARVMSITK